MSIRDIIKAAPRRTVYNDCSDCSMTRLDYDKCALCEDAYHCQRRFIATFDPEHVALMEAVCEAAADYLQDTCNECGFRTCEMPDSDIGCSLDDIRNTRAALQAYRKERGL